MEQYLKLLRDIKEKGIYKPPAREGMPGTQSLFGYQFRHNLADGFPLLTTKKMAWKSIVTELLWFLRGDTNIKYLVDNGCNIWNEDAYNYYLKRRKQALGEDDKDKSMNLEEFINMIKLGLTLKIEDGYKLGDCGYQYGKVWREWEGYEHRQEYEFGDELGNKYLTDKYEPFSIDQIANVIKSLKETPESRRHIVTAIDPAHDKDLALFWCHAMFQFNCRPLNTTQRIEYVDDYSLRARLYGQPLPSTEMDLEFLDIPKYYLDCQLYQRSCDFMLGAPFNIASYALLTHILAKICNMIVGELIISYGDVHLYENHFEQAEEQLKREPRRLPTLVFDGELEKIINENWYNDFDRFINQVKSTDFKVENYNPHPAIKAELSTGMKK